MVLPALIIIPNGLILGLTLNLRICFIKFGLILFIDLYISIARVFKRLSSIVDLSILPMHHSCCRSQYSPTGTPRQIDVDSMSILCRHVKDQISRNFVDIFTYVFDVILLIEKSTSFPRTFFWRNFACRKIPVVSTYYFWCDFNGQKIHFVSAYFFDETSIGKDSTSFLISCKLRKIFEEVFHCY